MSEKEKLLRTLFEDPERELVDIKFFRPNGNTPVSEEAFCAQVNKIIFEIDEGLTNSSPRFTGDTEKTVDVTELVKRHATHPA